METNFSPGSRRTGSQATTRFRFAVRVAFVFCALSFGSAWPDQQLEFVSQFGGDCRSVYVQGNYAYIGEGVFLTILDVSVPSAPVRVGRVQLPGLVAGQLNSGAIQVVGNRAYVAAELSGLHIVDVSNSAAPLLLGSYDTSGSARCVFVVGNLA
jgi:hypothetical protein